MAKKVKFPLDMGNNIMARTIEELKKHYNAEKVTEYFLNGKLLTWLKDRYYDEEAERVEKLSEQTNLHNPAAKLGEIFGIEIKESVNVEELETRREKLEKLRAITSDDEILENVDSVAFSQEELGDLLDEGAGVIYLCGDKFRIPLSVKNIKYIGVNNPAVSIGGKGETDLEESGISFEKCELPEEIKEKIATPTKSVDSEFKIKVYVPKQTVTTKNNNTVLAAEYDNETKYIYFRRVTLHEHRTYEFFNIYSDYKKSGHSGWDYYADCDDCDAHLCISNTEVFEKKDKKVYKNRVYIEDNPNSAFEIFKSQMLEALENLPSQFKKNDGIVDMTDSETIAAVEEAVRKFIEYRDLDNIGNN